MAADITINLSVNQKASFQVSLALKNSDGTAYDLSNAGVCAQYNTSYEASEDTSIEFGTDIPIGTDGIVILSLDPEATAALDPNIKYVYDVVVTDNDTGFKTRVVQGILKVSAGVTKITCP